MDCETISSAVTAVFDIGKTNKKLLLFDENYNCIYKKQDRLPQTEDEDGFPCEDLTVLVKWIYENILEVLEDEHFEISSLNFSTYGASLVHLDERGKAITPLYDYMKPYPDALERQFYTKYGGQDRFSLETASPPMGMLNAGLQLYWLKHAKPKLFEDIYYSLHLPQYLSFLFTGKYTSECTSIGCHTGLWDYEEDRYHSWLKEEDIVKLLPSVQAANKTCQVDYEDFLLETGPGIHDSSSALVPYLYALDEPFLLVSTGTWSITLNPFSADPLTYEELKKDCLCYLSVKGEQVKASRFFMGNEYDHQKKRLIQHFGRDDHEKGIELNKTILDKLVSNRNPRKKLVLETVQQSGPYPSKQEDQWKLDAFSSYEEAYHQLMLDLVSIQADCIALAEGSASVNSLIVAGGFTQNELFLKLLASRFPNKLIYTASLPNASALGAALVINNHNESRHHTIKKLLRLQQHSPIKNLDITSYAWHTESNG